MKDILPKLPGVILSAMSNPYAAAAAAILGTLAFFFLRKMIMPWFQKIQDVKNTQDVVTERKKSQTDNQEANDQLDAIMSSMEKKDVNNSK
jgi:hypothetical protein